MYGARSRNNRGPNRSRVRRKPPLWGGHYENSAMFVSRSKNAAKVSDRLVAVRNVGSNSKFKFEQMIRFLVEVCLSVSIFCGYMSKATAMIQAGDAMV